MLKLIKNLVLAVVYWIGEDEADVTELYERIRRAARR